MSISIFTRNKKKVSETYIYIYWTAIKIVYDILSADEKNEVNKIVTVVSVYTSAPNKSGRTKNPDKGIHKKLKNFKL